MPQHKICKLLWGMYQIAGAFCPKLFLCTEAPQHAAAFHMSVLR